MVPGGVRKELAISLDLIRFLESYVEKVFERIFGHSFGKIRQVSPGYEHSSSFVCQSDVVQVSQGSEGQGLNVLQT